METYSPISVGETWIDGYDNVWYILEYLHSWQNIFTYDAKCIRGSSIGLIKRFTKHGERQQPPAQYEGKKNLIKKVIDT